MTSADPDPGLLRQYDRALDEYRFQVDLNWRRSEYFFVLNVGVLIAAATMFSSEDVPRALVAVLFLIGALLALLSSLANEAQHSYYRAARALKSKLEKQLGLEDLALATTPGMGSSFKRLGRVRTFLKIMLVAIAIVDLGGAAFAIEDATADPKSRPPSPRTVLIHLESAKARSWNALVVSRGEKVVESRRLPPQAGRLLLEVPPGHYLVSLAGRSLCQRTIEVDRNSLQLATLAC